VLRGEGVFAGEDAYEQFRALTEVFQEEGAGLLVHPVWKAERAWFASLTVEEEPLPDYVRYSFEFWEDRDGAHTSLKEIEVADDNAEIAEYEESSGDKDVYIVVKGDTLWGIAKRYGVTLAALIRANPQIRNPNLIHPGDEVNIP